jgi:hypothetical protein
LPTQRAEYCLGFVGTAGECNYWLFRGARQLNARDPLLAGYADEFTCPAKRPAEIIPDCTRVNEFPHLFFGDKTVAMHRTTESHIPDSYEGYFKPIPKLLAAPKKIIKQ